MSYSLESPCSKCKKKNVCADGRIITGARDVIHSAPNGCNNNSWHQGAGSIVHTCHYFEQE